MTLQKRVKEVTATINPATGPITHLSFKTTNKF